MESKVQFTLRDPLVKGSIFGFVALSVIAPVVLAGAGLPLLGTAPVTGMMLVLIIFALSFAWIESRRLHERYCQRDATIVEMGRALNEAYNPRPTQFVIDDPKLKLSRGDIKHVLVGWLRVEMSGRQIAAEEGMLELELQASSSAHKDMARSPYYGKLEYDPRAKRYITNILGTYYTLPECYPLK